MRKSPVAYTAPKGAEVWAAIVEGADAKASDCLRSSLDETSPAIIGGLEFNTPKLYARIREIGLPYAFIDRAPVNGKRGSNIYRVIPNAYHANWLDAEASGRFLRFGGTLKPWQRTGGHILVSASSVPCMKFWGRPNWISEVCEEIRKHTDRPILVRPKGTPRPFDADLAGAWCVVSFLSMTAADAVMAGVPAFVDSANCAAPVALTDLSMIEKPIYPDREQWAETMANWQFTLDEMRSGYCWRKVTERL